VNTNRRLNAKVLLRGLLALVGATAIVACGSSDSPTSPSSSTSPGTATSSSGTNQPVHGTMTARIDGVLWSATTSLTATFNNNLLAVTGADAVTSIAFTISAPGIGTYLIPGAAGAQAGNNALLMITQNATSASWAADFTKGSGTVTLTSLTSTTVSGTFAFTLAPVAGTAATGGRTVTAGAFNINF